MKALDETLIAYIAGGDSWTGTPEGRAPADPADAFASGCANGSYADCARWLLIKGQNLLPSPPTGNMLP